MPDDVFERVHALATRQKANPGLVLADHDNQPMHDLEDYYEEEEDDEDFNPLEEGGEEDEDDTDYESEDEDDSDSNSKNDVNNDQEYHDEADNGSNDENESKDDNNCGNDNNTDDDDNEWVLEDGDPEGDVDLVHDAEAEGPNHVKQMKLRRQIFQWHQVFNQWKTQEWNPRKSQEWSMWRMRRRRKRMLLQMMVLVMIQQKKAVSKGHRGRNEIANKTMTTSRHRWHQEHGGVPSPTIEVQDP